MFIPGEAWLPAWRDWPLPGGPPASAQGGLWSCVEEPGWTSLGEGVDTASLPQISECHTALSLSWTHRTLVL